MGAGLKGGISEAYRNQKKVDAWLGVDSVNGIYTNGEKPVQGLVKCGETVNIEQRVWAPFQGERLFVSSRCASDFLINNVFVGASRGGAMPGQFTEAIIAEPFAVNFDDLATIEIGLHGNTVVTKRDGSDKEEIHEAPIVQIKVERKATELLGAPFYLPFAPAAISIIMQVTSLDIYHSRRFRAAFYGKALWS